MITIKAGEPMYAIEDTKVFKLVVNEPMTFESWQQQRQFTLAHGEEIKPRSYNNK